MITRWMGIFSIRMIVLVKILRIEYYLIIIENIEIRDIPKYMEAKTYET